MIPVTDLSTRPPGSFLIRKNLPELPSMEAVEQRGTRVDRFVLVRKIGEGGGAPTTGRFMESASHGR